MPVKKAKVPGNTLSQLQLQLIQTVLLSNECGHWLCASPVDWPPGFAVHVPNIIPCLSSLAKMLVSSPAGRWLQYKAANGIIDLNGSYAKYWLRPAYSEVGAQVSDSSRKTESCLPTVKAFVLLQRAQCTRIA